MVSGSRLAGTGVTHPLVVPWGPRKLRTRRPPITGSPVPDYARRKQGHTTGRTVLGPDPGAPTSEQYLWSNPED